MQPVDLGLRAGGPRRSRRIRLQLCMRRRELTLQLRHLRMHHWSAIMMTADGYETKGWPHLRERRRQPHWRTTLHLQRRKLERQGKPSRVFEHRQRLAGSRQPLPTRSGMKEEESTVGPRTCISE